MNVIKSKIDKKYKEFFNSDYSPKISKEWFYDFCFMLKSQGYSDERIDIILENMMSQSCLENMSQSGMIRSFGISPKDVENEKAFFEYIRDRLKRVKPEYLEDGLKYAEKEMHTNGNFIDSFIKYVVITNFSDLRVESDIKQMRQSEDEGQMYCMLGKFQLCRILCELRERGICFDELHTRKNLTSTKIGSVMFRHLMKEIHEHFPDKDLYADRVRKDNDGGIKFYKKMGGELFDYGSETQCGVIFRKEKMQELSEVPTVAPTLKQEEKNSFIDSLRVQVNDQPITLFPTDEEILQKMDKTDKMYSFDMEDIDKKIRIAKLTKHGEQLFLYRKKINTKNVLGYCNIYSQYYIVNLAGEIVGRIPISIGNPHLLSMDYWLKEDYQGKGIGTIALEEVIKQIYDKKEFDKLHFSSVKYPDIEETEIESIGLEISDDNQPSKRIATKNGFKKAGERFFSLTLEDYIKQRENTIRG